VEDDHMNIICLGGRITGPMLAWDVVGPSKIFDVSVSLTARRLAILNTIGYQEWRPLPVHLAKA
jgi:hypothetical protein